MAIIGTGMLQPLKLHLHKLKDTFVIPLEEFHCGIYVLHVYVYINVCVDIRVY